MVLSMNKLSRQVLNISTLSKASRNYSATTAFNDLKYILQSCDTNNKTKPIISKSSSVLDNVAQDASSYEFKRPDISIIPSSIHQLSECVKYCYSHDIPMVPVGARTGLEGGIHAMRGGISFDMSNLRDIVQVNVDDLDCHVQAGLTWRELNEQIKSHGLWFPVDPGASASLGGMSSTSASGTNAVKYGTMKENVLGLEIVVENGNMINTSGKHCRARKSSAGINLTNLFVGSEGTLGIITSIKLKLHALPSCIAVATVAFPNVQLASQSVVQVMQCGIPIARIEFLDQPGVRACYQATQLANLDPNRPMLFVELHALSENGLKDQIDIMKDIFEANESSKFNWSVKQEERTELWKARHNLHWSILNTKPGYLSIDTDVCVPISKFPDMVAKTQELIDRYQLDAPLMGHAGDGNFHSVILYDPKKSDMFDKAKLLASDMARVAIQLDGTVTGEHGVGRGKMDLIEEQFDEQTLGIMYKIKQSLDPKNLFNPDKMFKCSRFQSK